MFVEDWLYPTALVYVMVHWDTTAAVHAVELHASTALASAEVMQPLIALACATVALQELAASHPLQIALAPSTVPPSLTA